MSHASTRRHQTHLYLRAGDVTGGPSAAQTSSARRWASRHASAISSSLRTPMGNLSSQVGEQSSVEGATPRETLRASKSGIDANARLWKSHRRPWCRYNPVACERKLTSAAGVARFGGWCSRSDSLKHKQHLVQLSAAGYAPLNVSVQLKAGATMPVLSCMQKVKVS